MKPRPCCSHHITHGATNPTPVPARWVRVSETLEIITCVLCSFVTCVYTVQHGLFHQNTDELADDSPFSEQQQLATPDGQPTSGFGFRPSPELMLLSCLVFGGCVSSFTHRRQSRDPFQFVVYLILLGGAALVGYGLGTDPHLVLLGYLPFATCAAMAISASGHGAYRRLKPNTGARRRDEEKAQPCG